MALAYAKRLQNLFRERYLQPEASEVQGNDLCLGSCRSPRDIIKKSIRLRHACMQYLENLKRREPEKHTDETDSHRDGNLRRPRSTGTNTLRVRFRVARDLNSSRVRLQVPVRVLLPSPCMHARSRDKGTCYKNLCIAYSYATLSDNLRVSRANRDTPIPIYPATVAWKLRNLNAVKPDSECRRQPPVNCVWKTTCTAQMRISLAGLGICHLPNG